MKRNEEFEEFLNSLPKDVRKNFEAGIKRRMKYNKGLMDVLPAIVSHLQFLSSLPNEESTSEAKKKLLLEAEKKESLKGSEEAVALYREFAKECDWIRHVIDVKGIYRMKYAVNIVRAAIDRNYDMARLGIKKMDVRTDDAYKMVEYWENN